MTPQELASYRALLCAQLEAPKPSGRSPWRFAWRRRGEAATPLKPASAPLRLDVVCPIAPPPEWTDRFDDGLIAGPLPSRPPEFGRRTEIAPPPAAPPPEPLAQAPEVKPERVWLQPRPEEVVQAFAPPDEPPVGARARVSRSQRTLLELEASLRRERRIIDARLAVARIDAAAMELGRSQNVQGGVAAA